MAVSDYMPQFVGKLFEVEWFYQGVPLTAFDFQMNCTVQNWYVGHKYNHVNTKYETIVFEIYEL